MTKALRAALLSALVFPGAGLFSLRLYVRGCIFALPAILVLFLFFQFLQQQAALISVELTQHPERLDILQMATQLHDAIYASSVWQEGRWVLLASWILSIISSYTAGQKADQTSVDAQNDLPTESKTEHKP